MNVLVIDDSATLFKIFKIALQHSSYRVHHARSLMDASHSQSMADVFIIDADTAYADLPLFLETCRSTHSLILKSQHTKADLRTFEKHGYGHYLSKPFDSKDIMTVLSGIAPLSTLEGALSSTPRNNSGHPLKSNDAGTTSMDRPVLHANPQDQMEAFLVQEAPMIVKEAVREYCQEHFAKIARSVLTDELRRLADEKTRSLMDA